MPNTTNSPVTYNPALESLDTGVSGVPALQVDPSLTVNQNFSPDKFYGNMEAYLKNTNPWLKTEAFTTPYNTRLKDTLRYDDPKFGFDPFNPNIEYQYGDRQGALTKWKNNFLKFGATTIGTFMETVATLPLVFDATVHGDANKIENNQLTNGISEWLDSLETKLPNYETSFGKDHPVLNYVPFLGNTGDSWGGVLKTLGFTVGAIGGALVTDMAVGALTGGAGAVPLVGTQLTSAMGKLGKVVGAGSKSVESFTKLLQGGKTIEEALSTMSANAKAFNNVRYGLTLFTAATGESMIEANQAHKQIDADLKKQFFDAHGYDAAGADLDQINKDVKEGSNAVLLSNIGLLMLTESMMFESLLKPASAARGAALATVDDKVAVKLADGSLDVWEEVKPEKGFKGIMKKVSGSPYVRSIAIEGGQEGTQYVISQAADHFYKHKYDNPSQNGVGRFVESLSEGLHDVFNTREGIENIVIGGLVGAIVTPVRTAIEKQIGVHQSPQERLSQVLKTLNESPVTGLFTDKFNSAVTAYKLANNMTTSLQEGDLYNYHNNKFEQLFNFVSSGIRTHRLAAQLERLATIKDLPENQMRALLNITDPNISKQQLDAHVDAVIAKAEDIKSDVLKIDESFPNKYNPRSQSEAHAIFEEFKDKLAISLSEMKDNRLRMNSLAIEASRLIGNTNANKLVNLTNEDGVKQTIKDFQERLKQITIDEELFKGQPENQLPNIRKERTFLENTIAELEARLQETGADIGKFQYPVIVQDILNYYANGNSLNGDVHINSLDTLSAFDKAQDIWKLGEGIKQTQTYFEQLQNKKEFDKTIAQVQEFKKLAAQARAEEAAAQAAQNAVPASSTDDVVNSADNQEIDAEGNPVIPTSTIVATPAVEPIATPVSEGPFDPDKADAEIAAAKKAGKKPRLTKKKEEDIQNQITALKQQASAEYDAVIEQLTNLGNTPEEAKAGADKHAKMSPVGKKIAALEKQLNGEEVIVTPVKETTKKTPTVTVEVGLESPIPVIKEEKSAPPVTVKVEEGTKGERKYAFNPFKFFNKLFSKVFKDSGAEAKAKKDILLNKTPTEISSTATLVVKDSTTGMKFGEYKEIKDFPGIFYTGYKYDMDLMVDGKSIGKIQPGDRLFFKRGDTYIPISEITEEEYEKVTGNSPDTYNDFISEIKAYKNMVDGIEAEFKGGKTEFSNSDINKFFAISVRYGGFLSADTAADSTLLKNITYDKPGNVVLSIPMIFNKETKQNERAAPNVIGKEKLSPEQLVKLEAFITQNIDRIKAQNSRYLFIAVLPNGEYGLQSIIAARPIEAGEESLGELIKLIKEVPTTPEEAKEVNQEIKEKFYLADSTNTKGKGAKMFITIDEKGKVFLNILNKFVKYKVGGVEKTGYSRRIEIPKGKEAASIGELVERINGALYFQKSKDRALAHMGLIITKEDFKTGILKDENVKYEDIKNKLAVSVQHTDGKNSDVFENPNVYILPKGSKPTKTQTEVKPIAPKPIAPVVAKTVPVETKTSTKTSQVFNKDKEAKANARAEAKEQTPEEIDNEFLTSLGCK